MYNISAYKNLIYKYILFVFKGTIKVIKKSIEYINYISTHIIYYVTILRSLKTKIIYFRSNFVSILIYGEFIEFKISYYFYINV